MPSATALPYCESTILNLELKAYGEWVWSLSLPDSILSLVHVSSNAKPRIDLRPIIYTVSLLTRYAEHLLSLITPGSVVHVVWSKVSLLWSRVARFSTEK